MAEEIHNSSTTWECPPWVTSVEVECWGGGGGGGSGDQSQNDSGSGGGGGAYSKETVSVTPGNTYTVTVGVAGTAGVGDGVAGGAGGDTWFSTSGTVLAKGGAGGAGSGPSGGAGGTAASGVGTTKFSGGAGGNGNLSGGTGGGGGSSAGTGGIGGTGQASGSGGAGGTPPAGGGAGGDGQVSGGTPAAESGFAPGGGGGGGESTSGDGSGAAGAAGRVRLVYADPPPGRAAHRHADGRLADVHPRALRHDASLRHVAPPVPTETVQETFDATDSWTCPEGVFSVNAECWGGGGGGGRGSSVFEFSGYGGGGGAYSLGTVAVTPGNVYTVTVGAAGAAGTSSNGGAGGDSHFLDASTVMAKGGSGGGAGGAGGGATAGGQAAAGVGSTKFSGGTGGIRGDEGAGHGGGGGGSSAGTGANGGNGANGTTGGGAGGTPPAGGGAGGNGGAVNAVGSAGSAPGGAGGGGGATGDRAGAAGAAGRVVLTYEAPIVDDNAGRRRPRVALAPDLTPAAGTRRTDGALRVTGLEPPPPPAALVALRRLAAGELAAVVARALRHHGALGHVPAPQIALGMHARRRGVVAPDMTLVGRALRLAPRLVDWAKRYHLARGLYRVFAPAVYRFYRSNSGPPVEGDTPYATSVTLPATPADTFADGTWWISVSYFNGVVDSGFLPIGGNGETFRQLVVAGGVAVGTPPSPPLDVRLELRAGGVARVVALYAQEGALRAATWTIAYTTDGSTPAEDTPTVTQAFARTSGVEQLVYDLPAQVHGTTVKVRVQVRRGSGPGVYSDGSTVLTLVADAQGPAAPSGGEVWPGSLPDEVL